MAKDFTKHDKTMNKSATPASDHLFKTRDDEIFLEETQDNSYHNFFFEGTFSRQDRKTGHPHNSIIYKHASERSI